MPQKQTTGEGGKKIEFNGYSFLDPKMAKRMRYIIVFDGDLDLNGVYGFENKRELKKYLKESTRREIMAVFSVKYIDKFKI